MDGNLTRSDFYGCRNVRYEGVINPQNVPQVIRQYDALLLPTHYEKEGYPGAILEAYEAGLPVIVSNWPTIREIVDESCGLLIKSQSVDELHQAMEKLKENPEFYRQLAQGAIYKREQFSLETGVDKFIDYCESVVNGTWSADRE